jgi:hypothetical protein
VSPASGVRAARRGGAAGAATDIDTCDAVEERVACSCVGLVRGGGGQQASIWVCRCSSCVHALRACVTRARFDCVCSHACVQTCAGCARG